MEETAPGMQVASKRTAEGYDIEFAAEQQRVLAQGALELQVLGAHGGRRPQPVGLALVDGESLADARLGQPLEDSLRDMAKRIESTDFAFFITAVLIQRQTGGDLSEVLKNISGMRNSPKNVETATMPVAPATACPKGSLPTCRRTGRCMARK